MLPRLVPFAERSHPRHAEQLTAYLERRIRNKRRCQRDVRACALLLLVCIIAKGESKLFLPRLARAVISGWRPRDAASEWRPRTQHKFRPAQHGAGAE